jgi:hypothetical protein
MLLKPLESPQWVGVHSGGLVMFRLTVQELLNDEHFFQRRFNNIKIKYFWEIGAKLLILLSKNPCFSSV